MLKKLRSRITLILIVTTLVIVVFSTASAQVITNLPPEMPACFYGTVRQDGGIISGQVSVKTNDQLLAASTIMTLDFGSVYVLKAFGGQENSPVYFQVDGVSARSSLEAYYQSGECINIDLSLGEEVPLSSIYLPIILR